VTEKIRSFVNDVKPLGNILGTKMCGAGGGGCFILIHDGVNLNKLKEKIIEYGMEILPFEIDSPLN
jgi:D-glycero-alpha-D-manno-heptose-7-phosphate kinase